MRESEEHEFRASSIYQGIHRALNGMPPYDALGCPDAGLVLPSGYCPIRGFARDAPADLGVNWSIFASSPEPLNCPRQDAESAIKRRSAALKNIDSAPVA